LSDPTAPRGSTVSVLMPVYNGRRFVGQAIDSVLQQSFGDFELIVVDDGSTDGSADIVAGYSDSRVRSFRNQSNLGLVGNWNECLRRARGKYITMLHQDDVMEPDNLARKIAAITTTGRLWAASDCLQVDADGHILRDHWFGHQAALAVGDKPRRRQFDRMFYRRNYICFTTILWDRTVTDTLGGFEDKGGYCVDVYMWLKFLTRYPFTYLDERLIRYRWAQNESLKHNDDDWFYEDFVARREAARDFHLPRHYIACLKALYAPGFVKRYAECRFRRDARGAQLMRAGCGALLT